MAFQFLCPQGHLLQADASQMGRTINCPTCGMLFVVPTVTVPGAVQPVVPVPPAVPPPTPPAPPPSAEEPEDDLLNLNLRRRPLRRSAHVELDVASEPAVEEAPQLPPRPHAPAAFDPDGSTSRMVHIHCPQGHELITPRSTMGDEVMCPHCGEQFTLRYEATREYQQQHELKEEKRQEKLANSWLFWAVLAGVLVFIMLGAMIFFGTHR